MPNRGVTFNANDAKGREVGYPRRFGAEALGIAGWGVVSPSIPLPTGTSPARWKRSRESSLGALRGCAYWTVRNELHEKIGRASCRERVEDLGVGGSVKE